MQAGANPGSVEVVVTDQRRRRWPLAEKAELVQRTCGAGMKVCLLVGQEDIAPSLLFKWCKLDREGALMAVSAGEAVVPASELAATRAEIARLQRVLGKKTMEAEILREAVGVARSKKVACALECALANSTFALLGGWQDAPYTGRR